VILKQESGEHGAARSGRSHDGSCDRQEVEAWDAKGRGANNFTPQASPNKERAMLVLTRGRNECVRLITNSGEAITVCVVDVRGDKVRLGFDAPQSVMITRPEAKNKTPKQGDAK